MRRAPNFVISERISSSPAMDSSDSFSFPSEPPEIGKWFSSYVYESPELNTIVDDFKDSFDSIVPETEESQRESKQDLDGNIDLGRSGDFLLDEKGISVANCKNPTGDENCINKVLEHSDSFSLCSEPPDIKKWFSSYVYESPVLDTSFEFRSDHREYEGHEQENDANNSSKEKQETLSNSQRNLKDDNIPSDGLAECLDIVEDSENEDPCIPEDSDKAIGNQKSGTPSDLTTQWSLDQTLKKKTMEHQDNDSPKDFVVAGSSLDKLSSEVSNGLWNMTNGSHRKRDESAQESVLTTDLKEESSKAEDFINDTDIEIHGVDANAAKKTCGSIDKENNIGFSEDGFISTRRSRGRHGGKENSFGRACNNQEAKMRRKVLSETTNFESGNGNGITGKWKCPQKTKPNLGPPLKQLRLEKWLRRV